MDVCFSAPEYRSDDTFALAELRFAGDPASGWQVSRNGERWLELGPGYRRLDVTACGVCSTDLARRFLPFPLPQVTGHEVLARDDDGRRVVVEINASHASRGVDDPCPFCAGGLGNHCPERLVLGIHDLPGGFGPTILAPERAILPVPGAIPDATAVLVEPFAAALNAVTTISPRAGDRIAVLGPRRLGMLIVAALAAHRRRSGLGYDVVALSRRTALLAMARELGATEAIRVDGDGAELPDGLAEVVVDATGHPNGFELALRLATREVHVKSTHGRPAAGLAHLTELVVDELALGRYRRGDALEGTVAWLGDAPPGFTGALAGAGPELFARLEQNRERESAALPRADVAVVGAAERIDEAIRPLAGRQVALVVPRRGRILLSEAAARCTPLAEALAGRGLRVSSSRCGDFRAALEWIAADPALQGLGDRFVTHRFAPSRMAEAFVVARSADCLKAVVEHGEPR